MTEILYQTIFLVLSISHSKSSRKSKNHLPISIYNFQRSAFLSYLVIIMEEGKPQPAQTYFQLIQKVGSHGKYQYILITIFSIITLLTGAMSLGSPYYFAVAPYVNCPPQHKDCNAYVCSLPPHKRTPYLEPQINRLKTLGNRFGDFHCGEADKLSAAQGIFFVGSLCGFVVLGMMADNLGRRTTLLVCLVSAVVGELLVLLVNSLTAVAVGMFLAGFGLQNAFNLGFYFFSETLQNSLRQKAAVITQFCFCLGGLLMVLGFYLIGNWQPIFWIFCFVPLFICLCLSAYFLQETPQFLIKRHPVSKIMRSLRFIAALNGQAENFENNSGVSPSAIQELKDTYQRQIAAQNKKMFSFVDLFRYVSLRKLSLFVGLTIFAVDFLYYAPVMLIDEFGFNFFLNGVLLNCSQLITYVVSYFTIAKLKRRKLGLLLFSVALVCSFALVFLHKSEICEENCWSAAMVIELLIIFVFRFCISLEFQVLLIYINELYPIQVAAIGLSFASVVGTLPNIFIPELITISNRSNFPFMSFFVVASIIGIGASIPLRETRGKAAQEKINEFGHHQDKQDKELELVEQAI